MHLNQTVHASDYETLLALEHGTFLGYRVDQPGTAGAASDTTFVCLSADSGKVTVLRSIVLPTSPQAADEPLDAWEPRHSYEVGARIVDADGGVHAVYTAGTSGEDEPTWGDTSLTDGTLVWAKPEEVGEHRSKTHFRVARPASVGNWTLIKISHDALNVGVHNPKTGPAHTG